MILNETLNHILIPVENSPGHGGGLDEEDQMVQMAVQASLAEYGASTDLSKRKYLLVHIIIIINNLLIIIFITVIIINKTIYYFYYYYYYYYYYYFCYYYYY